MAYDKKLADKIRKALKDVSNVEEEEKMGGVTFMVNDKMCLRAHADGGMMMRCEPDRTEELLTKKGARRFEVKGKPPMNGWLVIAPDGISSRKDFDYWVDVALTFNSTFKTGKKKK